VGNKREAGVAAVDEPELEPRSPRDRLKGIFLRFQKAKTVVSQEWCMAFLLLAIPSSDSRRAAVVRMGWRSASIRNIDFRPAWNKA